MALDKTLIIFYILLIAVLIGVAIFLVHTSHEKTAACQKHGYDDYHTIGLGVEECYHYSETEKIFRAEGIK